MRQSCRVTTLTGVLNINSITLRRSKYLKSSNTDRFSSGIKSWHLQYDGKSSKVVIYAVLPGGYRNTSGSFNNQGNDANLWSSTENGSNAWNRNLNYNNTDVNRNNNNKDNGFSVRCVRDWYIIIRQMNRICWIY